MLEEGAADQAEVASQSGQVDAGEARIMVCQQCGIDGLLAHGVTFYQAQDGMILCQACRNLKNPSSFNGYNRNIQITPAPQFIAGMTLRDWFAGQALAGIMACGKRVELMGHEKEASASEQAYILADQMLVVRERS